MPCRSPAKAGAQFQRPTGPRPSPGNRGGDAPRGLPMTDKPKKVVLAYSGGLDPSIILKWLQTEYQAGVVPFTADLGQGEEVAPARAKAELLGIRPENIF